MNLKASRRISNIGLWTLNGAAAALVFPPIVGGHKNAAWVIGGFLALDLMSYTLHRAQHAIPLLWRFHALHHSDPDVDATTSVRHHPVEFLISTAAFWCAVTAFGIPATAVIAHANLTLALAVATHINMRWPAWLERALQPLLVTLGLHLVHHSIDPIDASTNFGAVLSVWDRLFGTFTPSHPVATFGVAGIDRAEACRPLRMLLTPWRIL